MYLHLQEKTKTLKEGMVHLIKKPLTNKDWQKLVEDDVLIFGNSDPSRLLEYEFVIPVLVRFLQEASNSVVFSHPGTNAINLFPYC